MALPLTVERSATVPARVAQIWAVVTDPDLLAECMDGFNAIRPLTGSDNRFEIEGTLLGQECHAFMVVDSRTPPALFTFHFEDWQVAGRRVKVAEENQYWFSITEDGDAAKVELGAGFKPYGRRNELELRASLLVMKYQFDKTLKRLAELAPDTQPAARPPATSAPVSRPRANSSQEGPSKKLQVGYFAATLGSRSRHPGIRGTSQLTAKLLQKRMDKQLAAAPRPADVRAALAGTDAMMAAISDYARAEPAPHLSALHQAFGDQTLLLRAEAARMFALGASHLGYAVRQAEEKLSSASPAVDDVADALLAEWHDPSLSDVQVVSRVAANYGVRSKDPGWEMTVMTLPWSLPDEREKWRDLSLKLLTNPGASFQRRPAGITDDQTRQCWEHGFAVRCCEMSLPSIPNRRRIFPPPR